MNEAADSVVFGVCLVDFHHKRGPEIEYWYGLPSQTQKQNLWANLPFQALPDGSHSFEETFTYFTLLYDEVNKCSPKNGAADISEDEKDNYSTLFAISCSRQIKTEDLLIKDKDVTRSTVQKAIVVVSREPIFGQIRDKLSIVTNAYFLQHDFTDKQILISLYDNLKVLYKSSADDDISESESRLYIGLCLRKILHDFKKDVLTLLKAIILEKKIIFYGSNVEYLCNLQFGLISLIPSLLLDLRDSGSPITYKDVSEMTRATSFKSSDRKSVLQFLGLPLQIFQKGGIFSPYTPLQQVDDIKSDKTAFFVIGSSNSLLYERRNELCDILVNVDTLTLEIIDKCLDAPLQLTAYDKKWIESIVAIVEETWNENDDETPKNSQFKGSEDFVRWQFEDYITGLISTVKLYDYINAHKGNQIALQTIPHDYINSNPWILFNNDWITMWESTKNYEIFNRLTDDRLFDLFTPKHPYNGIDNFTIFQQKLVSAFQNLRRHPSNASSPATSKYDQTNTSFPNKDIENMSSSKSEGDKENQNNDSKRGDSEDDDNPKENLWSSWKEYFNKKKTKHNDDENSLANDPNDNAMSAKSKSSSHKSRKEGKDDNVTNTNLQQKSTRRAIENALLGLGLHMDNQSADDTKSADSIESDDKQNSGDLTEQNTPSDEIEMIEKSPVASDDTNNDKGEKTDFKNLTLNDSKRDTA
ncbi:late secretory pathway protein avl9 [Maudiozyma exigua]|uniref:Late secretory pathway protein avl9 n=1 Tax=Maudiozyma exigua TaxID=34358 RepID=A0A9P6WEB8_MAUEX|nr:late secretory pathway protein avl9 [Kazachstania exigua]